VAEYERLVGWDKVVAIHANDSKFEVGFNKDRHENIGEGYISEVGFRNILHHPKFQEKAFLLEVPGFTNEGPDKPNLDRLRSYAK
jgi:deoxyribonuclease-4